MSPSGISAAKEQAAHSGRDDIRNTGRGLWCPTLALWLAFQSSQGKAPVLTTGRFPWERSGLEELPLPDLAHAS